MEQTPPHVDYEPRLGLVEQLLIGMRHARPVPDRQEGAENVGAGVEDLLNILTTRPQVGELGSGARERLAQRVRHAAGILATATRRIAGDYIRLLRTRNGDTMGS